MTSTQPPPAIKEHRYAISDERIAQLYSATEPQDCAMLMCHRDDVLGLIQRLRAAEARLAQVMASHPGFAIPIDEKTSAEADRVMQEAWNKKGGGK